MTGAISKRVVVVLRGTDLGFTKTGASRADPCRPGNNARGRHPKNRERRPSPDSLLDGRDERRALASVPDPPRSARGPRFSRTIALMLTPLLSLTIASSLLAAAPPPELGTIRQQVRRAKQELSVHPTLDDYRQSPFQPAQIVERVHALESDRAWAELCRELQLLPDDELELFEDEIRKPEHTKHLPCALRLLLRTATYWNEAERRLASAHPISWFGALPSVTVTVDTTKAPILRDGDLPPGEIALTFDDGPHATRTPRVLQILATARIKATFFQIGRNAAAHPDVARLVLAGGHT